MRFRTGDNTIGQVECPAASTLEAEKAAERRALAFVRQKVIGVPRAPRPARERAEAA